MRVLQQHLMPALLQLDVIVVCHAVKAVDAEPLVEQELGKVETDEAGSAGDEDFSHGRIQYDKKKLFRARNILGFMAISTNDLGYSDRHRIRFFQIVGLVLPMPRH